MFVKKEEKRKKKKKYELEVAWFNVQANSYSYSAYTMKLVQIAGASHKDFNSSSEDHLECGHINLLSPRKLNHWTKFFLPHGTALTALKSDTYPFGTGNCPQTTVVYRRQLFTGDNYL